MSIFLLVYDRHAGRLLQITSFEDSVRFEAVAARRRSEVQHRGKEVVLLEADSEDDLRKTHGRYFGKQGLDASRARVAQHQEEQLALDQFRRASELLPGEASRGNDPPDFVIVNGAHRISVETTAFHKGSDVKGGSKEATDESNAQRLVERAQTIFESTHPDIHIEVRPYLMRDRIERRDLGRLAELFADAVASRVPPLPEEGNPLTLADFTWADLPESISDVISHVSIARWRPERWKPVRSSAWLLGSVGYAATDVGQLERIIRRKEKDLARYRAGFDECWLIIYGLWQASSFFDFDYLKPHMFTSQFTGVAFVDAGTGRNVQIA
jgi:hypothetical protein